MLLATRKTACILILLFAALLLISGCDDQGDGETPVPEETPVATTPSESDAEEPTEDLAVATQPAPAGTRLTVWTIPDISPRSEVPGGTILAEQLTAFDNTNPGLTLEVDFKAEGGAAGTLNYLRTGQNVAPDILPDLILIPAGQLAEAQEAGLIFPLDDPATGQSLLDATLIDDLFPAAERLGRLNVDDGPLLGYPYVLNSVTHLAFDQGALEEGAPQTWTDLGNSDAQLIFPADGPEGTRLLLQLYLTAGGTLVNDAGQPALQTDPLVEALTVLERGRRSGTIVLESSNTRSFEQAWNTFAGGTGNVTLTDAHQFLSAQGRGEGITVAPVPGFDEPLSPLIDGWVWAVATTDPNRQQAAANLIGWLTSADNLGPWSQEAGYVPGRRSALQTWSEDGPQYPAFLNAQILNARPVPPTFTPIIEDTLAIALFDVVSLARTPASAAQEALDLLRP